MEVLEDGYLERGLYRNQNGLGLIVMGELYLDGTVKTLGRIYYAVATNDLNRSSVYLVTAESMRDAGYERVGD